MEEESKREKHRQTKREYAGEGVKVWNSHLTGHKTALKEYARREWNFEAFYNKAKRLVPFISREELREFCATQGIVLKKKPQPSGKVVKL
jgi:hypothetical protein